MAKRKGDREKRRNEEKEEEEGEEVEKQAEERVLLAAAPKWSASNRLLRTRFVPLLPSSLPLSRTSVANCFFLYRLVVKNRGETRAPSDAFATC